MSNDNSNPFQTGKDDALKPNPNPNPPQTAPEREAYWKGHGEGDYLKKQQQGQ
jgi:hypothetical protein